MKKNHYRYSGPLLILIFILLSALRDVYYGAAFQEIDFFFLVGLSFGLAILVFLPLAIWRNFNEVQLLARAWPVLLALNVTTALAWYLYFLGIKFLEPAIANTLWSGMGPVWLLIFALLEFGKKESVTSIDYLFQAGILGSLFYLFWIVFSHRSGLPDRGFEENIAGLMAVIGSAAAIVASVVLSKKLHDSGIGAESVVGFRFLLLASSAAIFFACNPSSPLPLVRTASLLPLCFFLVVLPIYCFQAGLQRTSTFAAEAIAAFGPILVFLAQFLDHRLEFSAHTLAAILLYSLFCTGNIWVRMRIL